MSSPGDADGSLTPVDFIQLQRYMEYSSLRVKDVMKEFNTGGRLIQHRFGERIDAEGFRLFLKTYLEVDDFPADFCQRLYRYFQSMEQEGPARAIQEGPARATWEGPARATQEGPARATQEGPSRATQDEGGPDGGIVLCDVSCYFSVLEEGQPRDKLEYTFKLYDKDGNGFLDSTEVDRIINQMMRAADYLGWDVTELRPEGCGQFRNPSTFDVVDGKSKVLKDMMTQIDVDSSGTVTLEEWLKGGMTNVPLLVLLGLKMTERDQHHIWRMKHFNRPTYCSVCHSMLLGLGKQGLCCTCCKYTVHSQCANKNPEPCAPTFVQSKKEIGVPGHGWMRADCNGNKCNVCDKKIKALAGKHCVWCHQMRHEECISSGSSWCDCGLLRDHILPPWAIYAVSKENSRPGSPEDTSLLDVTPDGHILQVVPVPDTHPLLVFVNPKSGGNQGRRVLRKFQFLLNPRQVYNLSNGGPAPGLHFFRNLHEYRILVCGGDGTVGWILDAIDRAELAVRPPVAVLPLGTGNDLARCMRWGGGYEGSDLRDILKEVEGSVSVLMDRWSIQVVPVDPQEKGDPVPQEIINNYFSIGVDASIAHCFHSMREKHPERFNSRMKNKLWYFEFATSETISSSCKKLKECLTIECCGQTLDLSAASLEGIAVLNIPSMHGGSNLWGESKKADRSTASEETPPAEVITDPELLKTVSQDTSDRRLEVVGVEGAIELGQIYSGLKSAGRRLAQTSQITIRTFKALPMQIDGEPWMQPACTIHITHKNQANMLMAAPTKSSGFFHLK